MALRPLLLLALLPVGGCARAEEVAVSPPAAEQRARQIEARKDALLFQLADCETGGHGTGASAYVGPFQFSTRTVIAYVRERDGRTVTVGEAAAIANDYGQASSLAKYMLFERDAHTQWPGCSDKLGMAHRVAEIRAL